MSSERFKEIVDRVDRMMFEQFGEDYDGEKRSEVLDRVVKYLKSHTKAVEKLDVGGVDDGLLKMLFKQGFSDRAIAAFFGVHKNTVARHRRALGIKPKSDWKPIDVDLSLPPGVVRIVEAYNRLGDCTAVAEELGLSRRTVWRALYVARHPERCRKPLFDRKIELHFVLARHCRNGSRKWLIEVFRKHAIHGKRIRFDSEEERIRFLTILFDGEKIDKVRKRVLTGWLKDVNMLRPDEVQRFYDMLARRPPIERFLPMASKF